MLVSFSVENFLSYKEKVTMEFYKNSSPISHTILLGANASGKSNFGNALMLLIDLLRKKNANDFTEDLTFLFDKRYTTKNSIFEIIFKVNELFYKYILTINFPDGVVVSESLLSSYNHAEFNSKDWIFKRKDKVDFSKSKIYESWDLRTVDNSGFGLEPQKTFFSLLLNNYYGSRPVVAALSETIKNFVFAPLQSTNLNAYDNPTHKQDRLLYNKLIQIADPSFEDIEISDANPEKRYVNHKNKIRIPLSKEAFGTLRTMELAPILFKTIKNGGFLIVDEYEFALHPQIVESIVNLFSDTSINTKNAQIMLIGHAGTLMGSKLVPHSNVWIAQRGIDYNSSIYNLDEYYRENYKKEILFDERQKQYLSGELFSSPYPNAVLKTIKQLLDNTGVENAPKI